MLIAPEWKLKWVEKTNKKKITDSLSRCRHMEVRLVRELEEKMVQEYWKSLKTNFNRLKPYFTLGSS